VGLGVGNNGGESGLGAGAGGGGNREERRQLLAYFELSAHLLNSLIRADDSCSRTLGAVHRRTAAESDEALAAVVKIELADFFDIVYRGVRLSLVIDDIIDTVCLETLIEAVKQVESGKTLVVTIIIFDRPFSLMTCGSFLTEPGPEIILGGVQSRKLTAILKTP